MSDIFISYSHHDLNAVEGIVDTIKNEVSEQSVWFDKSLRGGEDFFDKIAEQIVKCKYFVFVVSSSSLSSDWCSRELKLAASKRKRIIAVWLEDVEPKSGVELVIQNTHYIRHHALSAENFAIEIRRAFDIEFVSELSEELYIRNFQKDKYFLNKEQVKTIKMLLEAEKELKASVCFQPENAVLLGLAYEMGVKTEKNPKMAKLYYKVSAYYGNYDGQYLYAAFQRSQDTEDNAAKYIPDMIDAADHGSVFALTVLGEDYYYGINDFEKNHKKAIKMWEKAAEAGSAVAMYFIAMAFHYGADDIEKDLELSYMYLLKSVELGFPLAFSFLAYMYEYGKFIERNINQAICMYEKVAELGVYEGLNHAGDLYRNLGNYEKAFSSYEQAYNYALEGKINDANAFLDYGLMYEHGRYVPKDIIKAVEIYLQGAERGRTTFYWKTVINAICRIEDKKVRENYITKAHEIGGKGFDDLFERFMQ